MSPSEPSYHLWIAADGTRTIAALAPLTMSGSPVKHEWGSITELRAVPEAARSSRVPGVIVLCAVLVVGFFGLLCAAAPLPVIFILVMITLVAGLIAILYRKPPAQAKAPDQAAFPDLHRTLETTEERAGFSDLMELAKRAGRALPAVEEAIDPGEGGELLAQVLWEAADVLDRRQQLRPQLANRPRQTVPSAALASPAAQSLAQQRERTKAMWDQTEVELARILTALELAAVAAENAAHDTGARDAVREAYRELADLYGEKA